MIFSSKQQKWFDGQILSYSEIRPERCNVAITQPILKILFHKIFYEKSLLLTHDYFIRTSKYLASVYMFSYCDHSENVSI